MLDFAAIASGLPLPVGKGWGEGQSARQLNALPLNLSFSHREKGPCRAVSRKTSLFLKALICRQV